MTDKILRIFIIIVIGIIFFGLLVGGTHFYQKFIYQNPLEKALTKIEGIKVVELKQDKNHLVMELEFNSPEGLRKNFYLLLEQLQEQKINDLEHCLIKIKNTSYNEELANFLKEAKLPLYEAINTGHFTALPEQLTVLSQKDKLTYDLEIDKQFIFITVNKGESFAHLVINNGDSPLKIITIGGEEYF
ncbi:MAG: hypothetical protein ACOX2N_09750 [Peptococcia bacterium]|jgi:hypothetical protein